MYQFNANADHIINNSLKLKDEMHGAVLAIGNFDGVHKGHQYILEHALNIAKQDATKRVPFGVITFSPHPRAFFNAENSFFRLSDNATRAGLFEQLNLDLLVVLEFSKQLANLTAEDFVSKILVGLIKISHVIVGEDFCFGKNRQGDANFLKEMGVKYGFGVSILNQIEAADKVISSSHIRQALRDGNVEQASSLLGHHWYIEGIVESGQQLGRTIGFPTINVATRSCCELKHGTYAATVEFEGRSYYGAANFGSRPAVDGVGVRLETFIFNFNRDIYGKKVKVYLHKFIREDEKFNGLDELIKAIDGDVVQIKQYFAQNTIRADKIKKLN
ncbi:MAG: bifunctional riboflavin kinase/FAD synthetase [Rhizobiales bacterium]|nr:bifunctional riboflavin kinase/FAD synthetase [Hyphomicrobiales bacterium]